MSDKERALHKRLGKLKGRLFNLIGKIESMQLLLVSDGGTDENKVDMV